ncbi:hypothetical protein [Rhodopseudomonas sp. RCAM05734]|uniref:hypothetical protein n=1 Tax=Rhodopseudomonas sp. RCAM05734 TaxID=3457549 RepID=UPI0040441B85
MPPLNRTDFKALAFLRHGALVRRSGEWRFGATRVGDSVVERLIAAQRATRLWPNQPGDCVILRREAA